MKDTELVAALRTVVVMPSDCPNCKYKQNCSSDGCRLVWLAVDRLSKYDAALKTILALYKTAIGQRKAFLQQVLSLFDEWDGPAPQPPRMVCDFERCADVGELIKTLQYINGNAYEFSGATQDLSGMYTVFFRRPAIG